MPDLTAEQYRELARQCRAQANASMAGPASAMRDLATKYDAEADKLEGKPKD